MPVKKHTPRRSEAVAQVASYRPPPLPPSARLPWNRSGYHPQPASRRCSHTRHDVNDDDDARDARIDGQSVDVLMHHAQDLHVALRL
eukprot:2531514-Rhodomonas_salina.1